MQRDHNRHSPTGDPGSNLSLPSMHAEHAVRHTTEHDVDASGNPIEQLAQQGAANALTDEQAESQLSPAVQARVALDVGLPINASLVENVPDTPIQDTFATSQAVGIAAEAAEVPGKDLIASDLQELQPPSQVRYVNECAETRSASQTSQVRDYISHRLSSVEQADA